MPSLTRLLFVLSLAAAPLATASAPVPETLSSEGGGWATAEAVSVDRVTKNTARIDREVQELTTIIDGLRRQVAQLREHEDSRARVIGDPNNHPLWP